MVRPYFLFTLILIVLGTVQFSLGKDGEGGSGSMGGNYAPGFGLGAGFGGMGIGGGQYNPGSQLLNTFQMFENLCRFQADLEDILDPERTVEAQTGEHPFGVMGFPMLSPGSLPKDSLKKMKDLCIEIRRADIQKQSDRLHLYDRNLSEELKCPDCKIQIPSDPYGEIKGRKTP